MLGIFFAVQIEASDEISGFIKSGSGQALFCGKERDHSRRVVF
jgi:hypothetical protein